MVYPLSLAGRQSVVFLPILREKVFRSSMPHVQNAGNIWMVHRGRCPSVQSISVFNLRMVGWLLGNVYY